MTQITKQMCTWHGYNNISYTMAESLVKVGSKDVVDLSYSDSEKAP